MTISEALIELNENCIQPYRMMLTYPKRFRPINCADLRDDELLPLTPEELRRDDWGLYLRG
jgi:hypothetical protein